jgi:hypothetical protein
MTPLKARIFSLIRRAGPDGIDGHDLFALTYAGGYCPRGNGIRERRARSALKAHIGQLNKQLARERGWRIATSRCRGGWYRLEKTR